MTEASAAKSRLHASRRRRSASAQRFTAHGPPCRFRAPSAPLPSSTRRRRSHWPRMKENAGSGGEAHPGTATTPGLGKGTAPLAQTSQWAKMPLGYWGKIKWPTWTNTSTPLPGRSAWPAATPPPSFRHQAAARSLSLPLAALTIGANGKSFAQGQSRTCSLVRCWSPWGRDHDRRET